MAVTMWPAGCVARGPAIDERNWHPPITAVMIEQYDLGVTCAINLIVVPDGWTGPPPGPPAGVGLV